MILLKVTALLLFWGLSQSPISTNWKEVQCQDPGGFQIQRQFVFLDQEHFNREGLRRYFQQFVGPVEGELYVTASSNPLFLGALRNLPPASLHSDYRYVLPLKTAKPLAYFFRIGPNAFFQYRDSAGKVEWVVLGGENLFDWAVRGNSVLLAGQEFAGYGPEFLCRNARRGLTFVVGNLKEMELSNIKEILKFYDSVFRYPKEFSISLKGTFPEAATEGFPLPSLSGNLDPSKFTEFGKTVAYRRSDLGLRHMTIYEKGKPVFSQKLTASFAEKK